MKKKTEEEKCRTEGACTSRKSSYETEGSNEVYDLWRERERNERQSGDSLWFPVKMLIQGSSGVKMKELRD